jgi:heme/copper-type cytochrome/quinol oxidase subunit 2
MKKKIIGGVAVLGVLTPIVSVVANAATLLPKPIADILSKLGQEGTGTASFLGGRVASGLFIFMIFLVLFGVFYSLQAAFKYIRSEGDPGQMEEAQKGIKAIFFGIAAMAIGIIGIILVFVFLGINPVSPDVFQTCLTSPDSAGCRNCIAEGSKITPGTTTVGTDTFEFETPGNLCAFCELGFEAAGSPNGINSDTARNATIYATIKDFYDAGASGPINLHGSATAYNPVDCFDPTYKP